MEIGPIPFTAIVEYFRLYGEGSFQDFNYIIRRMDNAFLDFESNKKSKTRESNGGANKKNIGRR